MFTSQDVFDVFAKRAEQALKMATYSNDLETLEKARAFLKEAKLEALENLDKIDELKEIEELECAEKSFEDLEKENDENFFAAVGSLSRR